MEDINQEKKNKPNPSLIADTIINNHFKGGNLLYIGEESQRGGFYVYDQNPEEKTGVWTDCSALSIDKIIDDLNSSANIVFYTNVRAKLAIRTGISRQEMNSAKHLINLRNGMYDPIKDELLPHDKKYYSTVQLDFAYDKEAKPDKWLSFIDKMFYTDEEKSQLATLQEFMGYSFLPTAAFHKALVIHGIPHTSKSTLQKLWALMLGRDTYTATRLDEISKPNNIIRFKDKLVNFCDETEEDLQLHSEIFKKIVAGGEVEGEAKFKDAITFKPFMRFVILTNFLPIVTDSSGGVWRRLLLISLSHAIPEEERIRDYEDILFEEAPGIFNWCMDGLRRLYANDKFSESRTMEQFMERYKLESDPIQQYIYHRFAFMEPGEDTMEKIEKSELYKDYSLWFKEDYSAVGNKISPVSQRKFGDRVRERFGSMDKYFQITDTRLTAGLRGFNILCKQKYVGED